MEINFSNEIESATMVAQKAKSCYSYLKGQPLMIWGWFNSRQENCGEFPALKKHFGRDFSGEKKNFEDPASGKTKFWEALPREK